MITLTNNNDAIDQDSIRELGDVMEHFLDIHGSLDNGGGLDGLAVYILSQGYHKD